MTIRSSRAIVTHVKPTPVHRPKVPTAPIKRWRTGRKDTVVRVVRDTVPPHDTTIVLSPDALASVLHGLSDAATRDYANTKAPGGARRTHHILKALLQELAADSPVGELRAPRRQDRPNAGKRKPKEG